MSDLNGQELEELRSIIAPDSGYGAFTGLDKFQMFIDETEGLPSLAAVDTSKPFPNIAFQYIREIVAQQCMVLFLEALAGELRGKFLTRVQALMDPADIDRRTWYRTFSPTDPAFSICQREGVFEFFDDYHPFSSGMWAGASERKKDQINQSGHFFAIVTQDDVADLDAANNGIFNFAFNDWLNSLGEPAESQKRFVVFLFGRKAITWWDKWKVGGAAGPDGKSVFDDRSIFVKAFPTGQDGLADAKAALGRFLHSDIAGDAVCGPSGIIVLGEPMGEPDIAGGRNLSTDVDLVGYLRKRNPDHVQLWEPGWSLTKKLQAAEREELFKSTPIFVRAVADKQATIAALKGALMAPLVGALGYAEQETRTAWRDTVGKFRRAYWRPEGEWLDGSDDSGIEFAINGPLEEAGSKLALLAGFGELSESVVRTRFEDLPDDDPKRTLLSSKLQELGAAAEQHEDDTVAVSLDGLAESIRKFDRAKLNIVAAHDQRTRPGDKEHTINHFEEWDTRIDRFVGEFFPAKAPKILRIAVLFQNFDEFDGLRFAEGLTVRRWNLLKLKAGNNGWMFDAENLRHLNDVVTQMLQR